MAEHPAGLEQFPAATLVPETASAGPALDARALLSIISRRFWLVLATTALGILVAVAYLSLATPEYIATVRLAIDTRGQKILEAYEVVPALSAETEPIETQVEILRSRRIAEAALRRVDSISLKDEAAYEQAIYDLMSRLEVDRKGLSTVIDVSMSGANRHQVTRLVNALADAFLLDQVTTKQAAIRQASEWLTALVVELRQELESAEKRLLEHRSRSELPNSGQSISGLAELEAEVDAKRQLYTSSLKRLKEVQMQEGMQSPDARIIAYASVPMRPSYPVAGMTLALAALGSFVIGVAGALFIHKSKV